MIFFIILLIIIVVLIFIQRFRQVIFGRYIVNNFNRCNVVVDGKKGSGKDLVFQYVINHRHKDYYSNISYGNKYHNIELKDISVGNNTYDNFINDNVTKSNHKFYENVDFYISDGGIYLPSYMDSKLYKTYPSFPIYYALSRHLYNSNVHVNVQNFGRLWKALREQADFFVHVHKTRKILKHWLLIKITTYDKYDSACKYLSPLKNLHFNKFAKSERAIYNAQNGEIKSGYILLHTSKIKYNTRAFESKLLDGERINVCKKRKA